MQTLEVIFAALCAIDPEQNFLHTLAEYRELRCEGKSLFMRAAEAGDCSVLKFFLQQFNPSEHARLLNLRTNMGHTALHYACKNAHAEMIEFLIDQEADFTVKDSVRHKICLDELPDSSPVKASILTKIAMTGGFIGKTIPINWLHTSCSKRHKLWIRESFYW